MANMTTDEDIAFIEAMERAVGVGDSDAAGTYLHTDVVYTVGAQAPVRGVDAVIAYSREQSRLVRWDGHTLRGSWRSGDVLVVEVTSHFTRVADAKKIALPCTDIYRFRDGRIADWRVYADMSPFYDAG
jgi:ketosteroid isomerase-like protein